MWEQILYLTLVLYVLESKRIVYDKGINTVWSVIITISLTTFLLFIIGKIKVWTTMQHLTNKNFSIKLFCDSASTQKKRLCTVLVFATKIARLPLLSPLEMARFHNQYLDWLQMNTTKTTITTTKTPTTTIIQTWRQIRFVPAVPRRQSHPERDVKILMSLWGSSVSWIQHIKQCIWGWGAAHLQAHILDGLYHCRGNWTGIHYLNFIHVWCNSVKRLRKQNFIVI